MQQNLVFVVKFRKKGSFFWQKRTVVGAYYELQSEFQFNPAINMFVESKRLPTNKYCFDFPDGTKEVIPHWEDYEVKLGLDWVLAEAEAQKRRLEAGVTKDKDK
jgi:hypothetical protein